MQSCVQKKEGVEFTVSKCKTKAVMSVKPKKKVKLNLDKLRKKFKVLVDTHLLLVIKEEDEIIVHGYGELLFKTFTDKEKIERIARKIYGVGV